jgi:FkbM family methyltransferase
MMHQYLSKILKQGYNYTLKQVYNYQLNKSYKKFSKKSKINTKINIDLGKLGISYKTKFFINKNDRGLSTQLYSWGFREPVNTVCIYNFLRKEKNNLDAVIDIGANIGYFSILTNISGIKKTIAIEPVPQTFNILKKNIKKRRIKAYNIAISDKKEKVKMVVPRELNLAKVISSESDNKNLKNIVSVEAVSIKDLIIREKLEKSNIGLRMDMEGYEEKVINNLPREVYSLLFELHIPTIGIKNSLKILQILEEERFKIEWLIDDPKGYEQIPRYTTLDTYLKLFKKIGKKRCYFHPNKSIITKIIKKGKACPEIIAKKNI